MSWKDTQFGEGGGRGKESPIGPVRKPASSEREKGATQVEARESGLGATLTITPFGPGWKSRSEAGETVRGSDDSGAGEGCGGE